MLSGNARHSSQEAAPLVALPEFMRSPRPMTRQDRRVLTLMVIAGISIGYAGGLITHTFPRARVTLGLTEGEMSLVVAVTRAASLLALAFSFVADRRGRRGPFLVAFAMAPLANLGTAFAQDTATFAAFQSIARIGTVAAAGLAIVIIAEELTPAVRGYGLGIYALSGALGGGVSLTLLPIADWTDDGWRILFALSAVTLLVLPLLRRFLRESRAFVRTERRAPLSAVLHKGHARHFWPLAGVAFFIAAFSAPAVGLSMEWLIDDLAWPIGEARLLLMVFTGIGVGLGVLAGGRLSDIAGRRPTEVLSMILGLGGGVLFYTATSGWVIAPALFLSAFGASALTPAITAHRNELFPTGLRATAVAWIHNVAIFGGIAGFAFTALLIDTLGLSTTIRVLGVGVIAAAFLVLPLPETKGRDLIGRSEELRKTANEVETPVNSTASEPT